MQPKTNYMKQNPALNISKVSKIEDLRSITFK